MYRKSIISFFHFKHNIPNYVLQNWASYKVATRFYDAVYIRKNKNRIVSVVPPKESVSRRVVWAACCEHVSRHIHKSMSSPIVSPKWKSLYIDAIAVSTAGKRETIRRSLGFQNSFVQKFKN